MGIFEGIKATLKLADDIGDIPLKQSIINLQQQAFEMQEKYNETIETLKKDNEDLSRENLDLKKAFEQRGKLVKSNGHLWEINEKNEVIDGPLCVTCWEVEQKKISMVPARGNAFIKCPKCEHPMLQQKPGIIQ